MAGFIGIDVTGLPEVKEKLNKIPTEAFGAGTEEANKKIINIEKLYAPYRHISVRQAGGWASEKQRRYVMAKIRSGEITVPYRRTQTLARGWKALGSGSNQIVVNEVPYAGFVKDMASQTRGHMLRGWDVIQTDMQKHLETIVRAFEAGVNKALKKLGL